MLCMLYDEIEHSVYVCIYVCRENDREKRKREAHRHMGEVGERERGRERGLYDLQILYIV